MPLLGTNRSTSRRLHASGARCSTATASLTKAAGRCSGFVVEQAVQAPLGFRRSLWEEGPRVPVHVDGGGCLALEAADGSRTASAALLAVVADAADACLEPIQNKLSTRAALWPGHQYRCGHPTAWPLCVMAVLQCEHAVAEAWGRKALEQKHRVGDVIVSKVCIVKHKDLITLHNVIVSTLQCIGCTLQRTNSNSYIKNYKVPIALYKGIDSTL